MAAADLLPAALSDLDSDVSSDDGVVGVASIGRIEPGVTSGGEETSSINKLHPSRFLIAAGELGKQRDGAVRTGWATRFFILTPQTLFYFRRLKGRFGDLNFTLNLKDESVEIFGEERGRIFLSEIVHVFNTEEIVTLRRFDGKKALVARAKTVAAAKAWVTVISTSITRVEGKMIEIPETIVSVSKSEESVLGIQSMGMLEKYRDGTVRSGWSRRLFVKSSAMVLYFKCIHGSLLGDFRGSFQTDDIISVSSEEDPTYFTLTLNISGRKQVLLRTHDHRAGRAWVSTLAARSPGTLRTAPTGTFGNFKKFMGGSVAPATDEEMVSPPGERRSSNCGSIEGGWASATTSPKLPPTKSSLPFPSPAAGVGTLEKIQVIESVRLPEPDSPTFKLREFSPGENADSSSDDSPVPPMLTRPVLPLSVAPPPASSQFHQHAFPSPSGPSATPLGEAPAAGGVGLIQLPPTARPLETSEIFLIVTICNLALWVAGNVPSGAPIGLVVVNAIVVILILRCHSASTAATAVVSTANSALQFQSQPSMAAILKQKRGSFRGIEVGRAASPNDPTRVGKRGRRKVPSISAEPSPAAPVENLSIENLVSGNLTREQQIVLRLPAAGGTLKYGEGVRNCWSRVTGKYFSVRVGPDYKKNGKKAPSGEAFYHLLQADAFSCPNKINHVSSKFRLPEPLVSDDGSLPLPSLFVVNVIVPRESPSMFGGTSGDGPSTQFILYFALTPETLALSRNMADAPPALRLLKKWFDNADKDEALRCQFKFLNVVDNITELGLGSFLESYNGKPVLITRSGSFFRGVQDAPGRTPTKYIEFDMNVHKFNFIARKAFAGVQDRVKDFDVRVAFVIQGETNDELPEQILGCAAIHNIDLANIPALKL